MSPLILTFPLREVALEGVLKIPKIATNIEIHTDSHSSLMPAFSPVGVVQDGHLLSVIVRCVRAAQLFSGKVF